MENITADLTALFGSLKWFAIYLVASVFLIRAFMFFYTRITPYDELVLIEREHNVAAAITYTGAKIGMVIPMAFACFQSVSLIDFLIWSLIAFVAQLAVYVIAVIRSNKLPTKIVNGNIAPALRLAGSSVAVGLLNAAAMSY
jgi:putative membrane protein